MHEICWCTYFYYRKSNDIICSIKPQSFQGYMWRNECFRAKHKMSEKVVCKKKSLSAKTWILLCLQKNRKCHQDIFHFSSHLLNLIHFRLKVDLKVPSLTWGFRTRVASISTFQNSLTFPENFPRLWSLCATLKYINWHSH